LCAGEIRAVKKKPAEARGFSGGLITHRGSPNIPSHRLNHLFRGDQVHTSGEIGDDIHTEMMRLVLFIAIAQGNTPGPPAAA